VIDQQAQGGYTASVPENEESMTLWSDPVLLQVARDLYRSYYEAHKEQAERPLGVAVDPKTYRAQIIRSCKPILLPTETFVPTKYLEENAA
jgi:hypothetical protein